MSRPLANAEGSATCLRRLTVEAGLAAEQAILEGVREGEYRQAVLAWQPLDRALVMPQRQARLANFPHAKQVLAERGWPIVFRNSGGEPVPQSPAVVNVALVRRYPVGNIERAYRDLCEPWCGWLASRGVKADIGTVPGGYCDGRFNVRVAGRKLVGTAQRCRRCRDSNAMAVLVHGAMLFNGDRRALVATVNAFHQALGETLRYRPDRHIALLEACTLSQGREAEIAELLGYINVNKYAV